MVVIKLQLNNDIRRVNVPGPLSFKDLNDLAKTLFEGYLPQSFQFKYKDDEGDLITVSSDRELEEAFRLYKDQGILRLSISAPEKPQTNANGNSNAQNPTSFFNLLEKLVTENGFVRDLLNNLEVEIFSTPDSPRRGCGFSDVPQSEVVHPANCDGCESQIRGIRYKCTTCPDYDLCQKCLDKGIHSEHEYVQILRPSRRGCPMRGRPDIPHGPVVHNAICDACDSQIRGIRYKCTACPDYDLCEKCYAIKGVHNPDHKFDSISRPTCPWRRQCGNLNKPTNQSEVVHPATCDGCHQRIKGLRYKCENCIDYDLCQSCKDKNIHSEHSFTTLSRPIFTPPGWKSSEQEKQTEVPKVIPVSQPIQKEVTVPLMKVEPVPIKVVPSPKEEPVVPKPVVVKVEPVPVSSPKQEPVKVEPVVPSAPKLTPPASPVVPAKTSQPIPVPGPFELKLKQLEEMGFPNRARNIELLVKYNGDMIFVVKDLLDA